MLVVHKTQVVLFSLGAVYYLCAHLLTQELMKILCSFEHALYEQNILAYLLAKHAPLRDRVFFESTNAWLSGEQPGFHTHFKFDFSLTVMHNPTQHPQQRLPLLIHYAGCQFCGLARNDAWAAECMAHFVTTHTLARSRVAAAMGLHLEPINRTKYAGHIC